jgi:hypothetical protein
LILKIFNDTWVNLKFIKQKRRKMKKIILASLLILFMSTSGFSTLYREAKNGQDNGTDNNGKKNPATYQTVTTYFNNGLIFCNDPGASSCPKGTSLSSPDEENAVGFAIDQIANGTLNGTQVLGVLTVEWTATNSQPSNNSTIIVWNPATESKPTGQIND